MLKVAGLNRLTRWIRHLPQRVAYGFGLIAFRVMHSQSEHGNGIVAVVDVGLWGLFAKTLRVRLNKTRFGVPLTRSRRGAIRPFV